MGTGNEVIVFFDQLGFGWVVDGRLLKDIHRGILEEEEAPANRSLLRMIENLLVEKPVL